MESRQKRETHKSIGGQKCWRTAECDRRDGIQVNNINNVYVQDGRLGDWRRYHRYQRPDEQPRDTTLGETMEITGDANNRYLRINTDGNGERAGRRWRLTRASVDIDLKNAGGQQVFLFQVMRESRQRKETHKGNGGDVLEDLKLRKQSGVEKLGNHLNNDKTLMVRLVWDMWRNGNHTSAVTAN
ncbi:uncharacterized protein isoform X3 [Danio rerio]|uniref:Uncharacterized protein isoform X3 n=1 Tax=Danio rerio TaxID=7955 RepID=A0AC58GGZ6_DANRE